LTEIQLTDRNAEKLCRFTTPSEAILRSDAVNSIIYLVGLIVIVLAVLSFFGLS
jgi:hypothetical protein